MGLLSAMVVLSECLFFVRYPRLSVFALLVHVAKLSYSYRTIEVKSYEIRDYQSALCTKMVEFGS